MINQENWLNRSVAHATTKWLKDFLRQYLPLLQSDKMTAEDLESTIDRTLKSRGLDTIEQQKNPRSNIVQALKSIDPTHPAITLISPTTEQYQAINDNQQQIAIERETTFIKYGAIDPLVDLAANLIESDEWADIAAGLAILAGRRVSEIILSNFSISSDWVLYFSEMSKKVGSPTIEIPTLIPAQTVLAASDKLRSLLKIDETTFSLDHKTAVRQVNSRYAAKIRDAVVHHFARFIPARDNRDRIYTHNCRAVYTQIATHWFCPPAVTPARYKSAIQGHESLGARHHYDDYAIANEEGTNHDGRVGILLETIPDLVSVLISPVEETLPDQEPDALVSQKELDDPIKAQIIAAYQQILPRLTTKTSLLNRLKLMNRASGINLVILDEHKNIWHPTYNNEQLLSDADLNEDLEIELATPSINVVPQAPIIDTMEVVVEQHQAAKMNEPTALHSSNQSDPNIAWFIAMVDEQKQEIDRLKAKNNALQLMPPDARTSQPNHTGVDELLKLQAELEAKSSECDRLAAENSSLKVKIDRFRALLDGDSSVPTPKTSSPSITTQDDSPDLLSPDPKDYGHGDVADRLNWIIDCWIAWNLEQASSNSRASFSAKSLKTIGKLVGATYQPIVNTVLSNRAAEIAAHHVAMGMSPRHNTKINLEQILRLIAKEKLQLENWESIVV